MALDPLAHLCLRARLGHSFEDLVGLLAKRQRRRQIGKLLVAELAFHPPHLVVGLVEVSEPSSGTGQILELAALGGLADLAVDPALEADAGGPSLGHRFHFAGRAGSREGA